MKGEIEIGGQRFSRLTVIKSAGINKHRFRIWLCRCDCGNEVVVTGNSLRVGRTKSCGCYRIEKASVSIDMAGQRFNRLLVLSKYKVINESTYWTCICDCGTVKNVSRTALLNGTESCGCFRKEQVLKALTKHGLSNHPLMGVWGSIRNGCHNKKDGGNKDYGGRGVKMCKEWRFNFKKFYDWCMINGWKEGLEIDKDIKGDGLLYSPETCSVVTPKENNMHRRNSIYLTHNGETKTISEWCEAHGLRYGTIHARYKRGSKNPLELPSKHPHKKSVFIPKTTQ